MTQEDILDFIRQKLQDEVRLYDVRPQALDRVEPLVQRWGREDANSETGRFDLLRSVVGDDLSSKKILDVSAGCGNFLLQGNLAGLDVYGIEPEAWKLELIERKIQAYNLNPAWREKVVDAVAEDLPFPDGTFDIIDSWQTLEHVQSLDQSMREIYRVLKPGGIAVLHAPDYCSFFEGHYKLFWFPVMHGALAESYLKLRGRPVEGLHTFWPITKTKLMRSTRKAGFRSFNLKKLSYRQHFEKKFQRPSVMYSHLAADAVLGARQVFDETRNFGRIERDMHVLVVKPPVKESSAAQYLLQFNSR